MPVRDKVRLIFIKPFDGEGCMGANRLTMPEVRSIVTALSQSGLGELEVHADKWSIKVKCSSSICSGSVLPEVTLKNDVTLTQDALCHAESASIVKIKSKAAGHFLLRHPFHTKRYIDVGSYVSKDQLIAILKVGPMYLPVNSPCDGYVAKINITDGGIVGFDTELVAINQ